MIRLYYHPTPNPAKIALFLEEAGLPFETIAVDTAKGEQHLPSFRAQYPQVSLELSAPGVVETVDEDFDVQDVGEVTLRVANNIDPERDIQFTLGPVDSLDHASRLPNFGSKMGIDATRKWATEGFDRPWPDEVEMSAEVKARITKRWKEFGLE